MAILERIHRIARANITQWLNQVETPEAEVAAKISELETAATDAKNALAAFAVANKRMERNLADADATRRESLKRAEAAIQSGDDAAARRALGEKLRAEERIANLQPVLEGRRKTYNELKENLVRIHDHLNLARTRLLDLRARKRAAEAENVLDRSLASLIPPEESFFERLEDEVFEKETRAGIDRELRGIPDPAADPRIEAALAELKRVAAAKGETA